MAQIARTIAKALRLNEDLTEAISLAHDIGHTPFGHAGEEVLDRIVPGGFSHPEQSLRVVDLLEREGKGLNLTHEVRDGIRKHSKGKGDILPPPQEMPITLEGVVVRVADIIAYVNHDIDDALRAGVITPQEIPPACTRLLGASHGERIDTMVKDVIYQTLGAFSEGKGEIRMSQEVMEATLLLRDFLYERVYESDTVHGDFPKASKILVELYERFTQDEGFFLQEVGRRELYDTLERCVCDFLAGMTDRYAFQLYERIFLPRPWLIL